MAESEDVLTLAHTFLLTLGAKSQPQRSYKTGSYKSRGLKFFVTSPILTVVCFAREHKQALIGK